MNRHEAMRQTIQSDNLRRLGLTYDDAQQLRRISLTLQHWGERCCNEDIQTRDDGSAWVTYHGANCASGCTSYRIPNREAGALRRLDAIMKPHARRLTYYHQTDPHGAALYIVERKRLAEYTERNPTHAGLDCCYGSVGMAVY